MLPIIAASNSVRWKIPPFQARAPIIYIIIGTVPYVRITLYLFNSCLTLSGYTIVTNWFLRSTTLHSTAQLSRLPCAMGNDVQVH